MKIALRSTILAALLVIPGVNTVFADDGNAEKSEGSIQDLVNEVANNMLLMSSTGAGKVWEGFEGRLLAHLELTRETPNYQAEITKFWNKNHRKMIITNELVGYRSPQHILKRAVEMNEISQFFFEYFLRDQKRNLNAVEWVDGKPETLLDYLNKIIGNPKVHKLYNMNQVRQLKLFIITQMDAKTGSEVVEESKKGKGGSAAPDPSATKGPRN